MSTPRFANLHATLRELRLVGLQLEDCDWDNLAKLSQIDSVVLMRTTLRDAGLVKLTQLPHLRHLEIPVTHITSAPRP